MPIDFNKPYIVQMTGRQLMLAMEIFGLEQQKLRGYGSGWTVLNESDPNVLDELVEALQIPYDAMIKPALEYKIVDGQYVFGN
jgi:hypothetical protein